MGGPETINLTDPQKHWPVLLIDADFSLMQFSLVRNRLVETLKC